MQLSWDAIPNMLSNHRVIKKGQQCTGSHRPQPFYCPCASDLNEWSKDRPFGSGYARFERDGENGGESMPHLRSQSRAAQLLLIYAVALVLPLSVGVQVCYRTLFGTEECPSMLVVLFTDLKRFHRWLQEDLRHVAAITVMGCLLYTSPSPRDRTRSRMPSSA